MSTIIAKQIVASIRKSRKDKEAVMLLSEGGGRYDRISTQCMALDEILGGGLPLGKIIEIYGSEGSGKTTCAMHLLVEAQQLGGIAVMIDMENAFDPDYAEALGIDDKQLIFSQPDSGNEAFEIAKDIMKAKFAIPKMADKPLVIVVDSVAALAEEGELEKGVGDHSYAPVARLLSQSLRRLRKVIGTTNTLFVFLNQVREKIGTWGGGSKSTGGRALKFYSSIRLELRITQQLKIKGERVGQTVKAKTIKNRTHPPFKEVEFRIIWGKGIDTVHSLFEAAVEQRIVKKVGNWYNFGQFKHQGVSTFCQELADEPVLVEKIRRRLVR